MIFQCHSSRSFFFFLWCHWKIILEFILMVLRINWCKLWELYVGRYEASKTRRSELCSWKFKFIICWESIWGFWVKKNIRSAFYVCKWCKCSEPPLILLILFLLNDDTEVWLLVFLVLAEASRIRGDNLHGLTFGSIKVIIWLLNFHLVCKGAVLLWCQGSPSICWKPIFALN